MTVGAVAPSMAGDLKGALELLLVVHPRPYAYVAERLEAGLDRETARLDAPEAASDVDLAGFSRRR